MSAIKEMIQNPHWIYRRYAPYWNFLLSSYEGGMDYSNSLVIGQSKDGNSGGMFGDIFRLFVNGVQQNTREIHGNLFMHAKERTEDYNRRVQMSYYYNFCGPIIDIYTDHLFKQKVIVSFKTIEEDVEQVKNNIDRQGSSIEEFRKTVAQKAQTYGHCFVVVDTPNLKGVEVRTRAEQIANKAFPYFCLYDPQDLINWAVDEFGRPYWVLLRETYNANKDPKAFNKDKHSQCFYRLWTREYWELYDGEYNLIDTGTHELGEVPITVFYDKKSQKAKGFLGISSIADISFIARDIYNASSELRQILRDQTFAFLAIQGTSDEYPLVDLGTGKGLLYPENRNKPEYVSPPSDNARVYFDHIDRQIGKIYQIAKLDSGGVSAKSSSIPAGGGIVDAQSGASKAWDFNQTNSSLSSKSSNLEDGEIRIWYLFAKWLGKDFDGNVQYPNEFSISSLFDDLTMAEKEARLSMGKTYNTEIRKAIARKKFPRKSEEELEKMDQEIEALAVKADAGTAMAQRFSYVFQRQNTATGGQNRGEQ